MNTYHVHTHNGIVTVKGNKAEDHNGDHSLVIREDGRTVAAFAPFAWQHFTVEHHDKEPRDVITVVVDWQKVSQVASAGPFSGTESDRAIVRRVREQVADAAEREAWKRLTAED